MNAAPNDPFNPKNANRAFTRCGKPARFWQTEELELASGAKFVFMGFVQLHAGDIMDGPHLWQRNGGWREDEKSHALDLMLK